MVDGGNNNNMETNQVGMIKIRNITELVGDRALLEEEVITTPVKKRRNRKSTTTTGRKRASAPENIIVEKTTKTPPPVKTGKRGVGRSTQKEPPPNQLRIDSFFKSCTKSFGIEANAVTMANGKENQNEEKREWPECGKRGGPAKAVRRKRLFVESSSTTETHQSPRKKDSKRGNCVAGAQSQMSPDVCIDLCSDSEVEEEDGTGNKEKCKSLAETVPPECPLQNGTSLVTTGKADSESNNSGSVPSKSTVLRRKRPCPPYKLISGTSFAVDAFQYGYVEGVTHYFLTHFHADHYAGLTRKFAMPLYLSPITARLVRAFIPIEETYLHEISMNEPIVIDGVEVTALNANHCPGAVMLVFKILATGRCILHTGDFRACAEMESEPMFWNVDMDTIYLDTTYISQKYSFCTQHESIDQAKGLVEEFHAKHPDERILHICGSYVIGKEKFWSAIANEFGLTVWSEENRYRALQAMQCDDLMSLLCDDPYKANMHILTLGKLNYPTLLDYLKKYESHFDVVLALRPSGWEKNSRPQYRGKINIIGVEYSEHSGHSELQRFVSYLKPREVISTVPVARDPMITAKIPQKWYKYEKLLGSRNFQPSITTYLKRKTRIDARPPTNANGVDVVNSSEAWHLSPRKSKPDTLAENKSELLSKSSPMCSWKASIIKHFEDSILCNATPATHVANGGESLGKELKTFPSLFSLETKERMADGDADAVEDWMS